MSAEEDTRRLAAESLAAGDATGWFEKLYTEAESGTAAVVVTHDPEVALRTDRTIHIRDGRLAAEGATRPVLILDEHGWLRLPQRLREEAGFRERVRASAS